MAYTNSFKSPDWPDLLPGYYGPDPYDINWIMPLHEETLESDRIKLTPFIPSLHAKEYAEQSAAYPDLHRLFPIDLSNLDQILTKVELFMRRQPVCILFAVIDKARGGVLAGVIGLINTWPVNLSTEIGWVLVFPAFRHTYVETNAIGLLLRYCLEPPCEPQTPGLGFRRVQWMAFAESPSSCAMAKRMGFREEGTFRWTWVLLDGMEGKGMPVRKGDPEGSRPGRHSVAFSLCTDDWKNGGREHVQHLIDHQ
jgi:RimJ/RimL family protein N-acetyltransferase